MFLRLTQACRGYMRLIDKYPWRTQALTTAGLMGGGDLLAQVCISRHSLKDYDKTRAARFLGAGFFVFGPGMHLWYSYLDRRIQGSLIKKVTMKLMLDQGFFLPLYLGVFVVLMGVLRRDSRADIDRQLRVDYKPMLLTSYALWPPVQAVSFAFLPGQFRVILINVVSLFWNMYLSWKAERKVVHVHLEKSLPEM